MHRRLPTAKGDPSRPEGVLRAEPRKPGREQSLRAKPKPDDVQLRKGTLHPPAKDALRCRRRWTKLGMGCVSEFTVSFSARTHVPVVNLTVFADDYPVPNVALKLRCSPFGARVRLNAAE